MNVLELTWHLRELALMGCTHHLVGHVAKVSTSQGWQNGVGAAVDSLTLPRQLVLV